MAGLAPPIPKRRALSCSYNSVAELISPQSPVVLPLAASDDIELPGYDLKIEEQPLFSST